MKKIKKLSFLCIATIHLCGCTPTKKWTPPTDPLTFDLTKWLCDDINHWHGGASDGSDKITDVTPHYFGEWIVTKEASCIEKGIRKHTCIYCNKSIEEEIPIVSHTSSTPKVVVENGVSKLVTYCSVCDEPLDSQDYTNTKYIYYGNYPQSIVDNETSIELTTIYAQSSNLPTSDNLNGWSYYNYYLNSTIQKFAYYIDIDQDNDGTNDYRGVYFTSYRPLYTTDSKSPSEDSSMQFLNGYSTNTVYWFKYEPIKWKILEKNTDDNLVLLLSDLVLDTQEYYHILDDRSDETSDDIGNTSTITISPNNYKYSNIRTWINDTFYNRAFDENERSIVDDTIIDNSINTTTSYNKYTCDNTTDKMFLLSYKDINNLNYFSSDTALVTTASDYAKAQGLNTNDAACWRLRSPANSSDSVGIINNSSYQSQIEGCCVTNTRFGGIRPACWIKLNINNLDE